MTGVRDELSQYGKPSLPLCLERIPVPAGQRFEGGDFLDRQGAGFVVAAPVVDPLSEGEPVEDL